MDESQHEHNPDEVEYLMVLPKAIPAEGDSIPAKDDRRWSVCAGLLCLLCLFAIAAVVTFFIKTNWN